MKPKVPLIIIIMGIVLLIGGLIFVLKYKVGSRETEISQENFKDSDNDGLRDWEEELFRTDPNNPDTDGDGYFDGEEVNSGHNPLIKAPGDKLGFYPLPLGNKYNVTKKVLSDEIMDSIIDSYLYQKGQYILNNEIYSAEAFSALTKQSTIQEMALRAFGENYSVILEKAGETILSLPDLFNIEITDDNIKISEDNSSEAINLYLSQLTSFLNSDISLLQDQSFRVLESALKNQDFSQLDKLIKTNDSQIESIKKITVPSSWKEIHKQTLKLTIVLRNIYVSLRDIQNDPLKAYIALEKLEGFSDAWNNLREKIINLAENI